MVSETSKNFPSARQVQKAFNQPDVLQWNVSPPDSSKNLLGLWVDAKITTVGSGMTTVPISQAINELVAHDENEKLVMDVDQYSLDLAAGIGQYWQRQNAARGSYRNGPAALDPVNVAGGATLYGRWFLYAPLPGKAFSVSANLLSMQNVFGTGMTGGQLSMSVVPVFVDRNSLLEQYTLYAKIINATQKGFKSVYLAALFSQVEWSTIQSGIDLGGKLSPEQVTRMENFYDDALLEYIAQSASAVNPDVKPLSDISLNPTQDVFALAAEFASKEALISYGLTTQSIIKAIIYSDLPTDQIAINVST